MKFSKLLFVVAVTAITSCEKTTRDPQPTFEEKTIKGMVINAATDSGFADVPVQLNAFVNGENINVLQTVSGAGGAFEFPGVKVSKDSRYTYAVSIKDLGQSSPEDSSLTGWTGTSMHFTGSEAEQLLKPMIAPKFYLFRIYCVKKNKPLKDSMWVQFIQHTFHKNMPDLPHILRNGQSGSHPDVVSHHYKGYRMGSHEVVMKIKTEDGTVTEQNLGYVYIGWRSNSSYTVHW